MNFQNVGRPKPQREYFFDASFCLLDANVGVNAMDHDRVKLYELVEHLLIRLELKLRHLFAECVQNVECDQRDQEAGD